MSAAPHPHGRPVYAGLRMTASEYLALGETPDRYELIDGVVVMSPSALPRHGRMAAEVIGQLRNYAFSFPEIDAPQVFVETDLRVSSRVVYRPDISVYGPGRLDQSVERLEIPPDLIVEILSPGTRPLDLITKRGDYERFGVREYWVGDPETGEMRCWRQGGGAFEEVRVAGPSLDCASLPGLKLDLPALRRLCGSTREPGAEI